MNLRGFNIKIKAFLFSDKMEKTILIFLLLILFISIYTINSIEREEILTLDQIYDKNSKISTIEYPNINETRYQGEALVRIIESEDRIHKLWTPITGKITAINNRVKDDYSKLYKDPYIAGWLVQMTPTNLDNDLKNLVVT